MSENPTASTSSTLEHGDGAPKSGPRPDAGGGVMPASLNDLSARLVKAGEGGDSPAPAPERRGLSELSLRVLQRWGALPAKAVAVFSGWALSVGEEDSQLVGECMVDVVRHGAMAPDPATEAYWRLGGALAGVFGEGYLATLEKRLLEKNKASEPAGG